MLKQINLPSSFILLIIISFSSSAESDLERPSATTTIANFHRQLLTTMQSKGNFIDRYQSLESVVTSSFDIATIARISLGQTWKTLDDSDKTQFQQLMKKIIVSTYAERFDSYSNQQFTILDSYQSKPNHWVVKTKLTKADGDKVSLNYYFKHHKIFNVVANGVSDLSLRRSDYSAVIKQSGYVALIELLGQSLNHELKATLI